MAQSRIVDTRGRPYELATLNKELAAPSLTGIRQIWRAETVAGGLTPDRLARILRAADQGDAHAYLTLAEEMEERDLHYAGVLRTRKLAVDGLEVTVDAASDSPRDVEIADAVRDVIETPSFEDTKPDLLDALGKSYSVAEIIWQSHRGERRWRPELVWRDPRFFVFDRNDGRTLRLLDEHDSFNGVALPPAKFICHIPKLKSGLPIRGGLARLACIAYMAKAWAVKDWLAFAEVFGMPLRLGRYGPNASDSDINTLIAAVANIGSDAAAVIPESMRIEFQQAAQGAGGDKLFQVLADWWDKQVSKGVLGQTMTTDDGSSQSQATVHNEVRQDLLDADAAQLSRTYNRDFVRPFVDLNFGVQADYPRLVIKRQDNEDLTLLLTALEKLVPLGLKVEQSLIRDKFGLPDPDAKADLLTAPGAGPAPDPALNQQQRLALNARLANIEDELDQLAAAQLSDWQPQLDGVLDPVRVLAQQARTADEFIAGLPGLLAKMDANELIKRLALATFQARGLGDQRD